MNRNRSQEGLLRAALIFIATMFPSAILGQLSPFEIEELSMDLKRAGASFTVGENPATKTPLESLCGLRIPSKVASISVRSSAPEIPIASNLPESFDWRARGGCTSIRDQLHCGACWAFGTIALLESNLLIKNGRIADLSEQWLVSCNSDDWGCDGGWWAHDYLVDPGAVYESDFPYVAMDVPCGGPYNHPYRVKSWRYVYMEYSVAPTDMIKQALMEYGPSSSAIYAGVAFQSYTGGVFNVSESGPGIVNHAVTIVGWDDNLGGGSWIIRNSWGTGWGEHGYMYITYGTSNIGYSANYVEFESGVDLVLYGVDDDNDGGSAGNGNGLIEPGETIELTLTLRNNTSTTVTSVTGSITLSDPYVTAVIEDVSFYEDIPPFQEKASATPYVLSIGAPVPQGHKINVNLSVQSNEGSWNAYLLIPIHSDPVITVAPEHFSDEIVTSGGATLNLVIGNEGVWGLDFALGAIPTFGLLSEDYPSSRISSPSLGGPDAFGYAWIDSDEPDGPKYEWIEIKGVGTPLLLGDDDAAQVALPFSFPFYGLEKNALLISSNGYITFGEEGKAYSNHPIPYKQTPNDLIAPRWRDFNPALGNQGVVYYYHDAPSQRFIIQWDQMESYPSGYPETFQVILIPDGGIYFQYKTIAAEKSGTVGIENATGDDGLQISITNSYPRNDLAVYICPGAEHVSYESLMGVVSPGETIIAPIMFEAPNDGDEGIHTGRILIKSNDPGGLVAIPFILDVWGEGPQIIHAPYRDTYNDEGPYIIEGLIRTKAGFDVEGPRLNWKLSNDADFHEIPMESEANDVWRAEIPAQTAGNEIHYYLYARDIENKAKTNPKEAPIQIHRFSVIPKPSLTILGSSPIEKTLPSNATAYISPGFRILNSGNDDLSYSIGIDYAPASIKNAVKAESGANRLTSRAAGEIITSWNAPSYVEWPWGIGCDGTRAWIGGTGNELSPPYTCENWEFNPDGTATGRHFSCNEWRGSWSADMTWDGNYLWQVNVEGDNGIYQLDPDNGNVINSLTDPEGIWSGVSQRGIGYRSKDDTFYIGGWNSGRVYRIQGLSWESPGSIISSFAFPSVSGLEWHPAGYLFIATQDAPDMIYKVEPETGTTVSQFAHPAQGSNYGGGLAINENGDLWVTKQGTQTVYLVESGEDVFDWLKVEPLTGTVGISDEHPISLRFDSTSLADGEYLADITIASNDPEKTAFKIPVELHVNSDLSLPEWNIMLYLDGDNNLEPYALIDFMDASSVFLTDQTRVLIQLDRIGGYSSEYGDWTICHRFVLEQGMTPEESNAVSDWGDGQGGGREVNMADPDTLSQFINWGVSNYPAKRYAVILWNHGDGWRIMETPAMKAVCWDETSKDYMLTSELRAALENVSTHLDVIGMDACLMGMIEVAYEIRNQGDIYVASEANIPVKGWPYDLILGDLATTPSMSPSDFATAIVKRYGESYNMDRTLSATRLDEMDNVAEAASQLASSLMDVNTQWTFVAEARNLASYYDDWREYRDLRGFAQALISLASDESIRQKAGNLRDALDAATIAAHYPGYLPSFGLSTYFVNPNRTNIDFYYNCSNILYACDTQWDEFLKAFLTVDVAPPIIQHIPLSNTLDVAGPYHIQASVQDASGVKEVTLFWRRNNERLHAQKMILDGSNYAGAIPGPSQIGDRYSYQIEAFDNPGNRGYYPGPGNAYFRSFYIGDAFLGLWEEFTWLRLFDLSHKRLTFVPNPLNARQYDVCVENALEWSVNPDLGVEVFLGDDAFHPCDLSRGAVSFWGNPYDRIFIGSNGYITFIEGDTEYYASPSNHFRLPRASPAFIDFNPADGGTIRFHETQDRAVVTFRGIKEYDEPGTNDFQVELFYCGVIRFTYLDMSVTGCITGLSNGQGAPQGSQTDFSSLSGCASWAPPVVAITTPEDGRSGNVTVEYSLYDANSLSSSIHVQFSLDNGVTWRAASDGRGGEGRRDLSGSPGGVLHTYVWNAMANLERESLFSVKLQITPFHERGVGAPGETGAFLAYNPSLVQVAGYLLGAMTAPGGESWRLDVNQDGNVDVADIVTLKNNQ